MNVVPFSPGLKPTNPVEVQSHLCTDVEAANRFAEAYGPICRYCPELGWVLWDGRRWKADAVGDVKQAAATVAQSYRDTATEYENPKTAEYLFRWAKQCETNRGTMNFLEMAKHRMYTPIDEFDTKPLCVNTPNTLLSFEHLDKESEVPHFSDHNSAMNITKITASPWTMGAPANRWNAFLEEIIPSADVREYLQRAAGYSILGLTREQCFFICYGSGLNGKSTFLSVLLKVLGPDYSAQVGAETFMQQRNDRIRADLARLRGMRLVSAVETAENRRLDEALVKSCTGGDPIVAEHKFKEPFQFYPQFTLWLATNHKPRVLDTSYAMWRRVRLIPFTQTIPVDKVDPDLESKLLQEREGIMDWVVTGAVHYLRDGLKPPEEVTAASESYRKEEDTLGQFFDDRCTAAPAAQISRSDLYVAYKEWAESNGERPLGQRQFSHLCQERGFDSYKAHGIRYWVGLEVNP